MPPEVNRCIFLRKMLLQCVDCDAKSQLCILSSTLNILPGGAPACLFVRLCVM